MAPSAEKVQADRHINIKDNHRRLVSKMRAMDESKQRGAILKLFTIVFEQEYNDLSDKELIRLNRSNTLTGISYFALQNVLTKRGLTTYRIIEIEKEADPEENNCLNAIEKCLPGTVRRRSHGAPSSLPVGLQNLTLFFKQVFMFSRGSGTFARQKGG